VLEEQLTATLAALIEILEVLIGGPGV